MNLAIMQPYLFPYAGYFNLLGQVDKFVFYDDVNFIKGGWINRNRLILSNEIRYFTIPLRGASPNLKINQIGVQPKKIWERKILESIRQSYSKAPNFSRCFDLIEDVFNTESEQIAEFAKRSVIKVSERLEYTNLFIDSSDKYENSYLSGAERVVDICRLEGASTYINLPGGKALYECANFASAGLELRFSRPALVSYDQAGRGFEPGLSIIDMMMFNTFEDCRLLIAQESSE